MIKSAFYCGLPQSFFLCMLAELHYLPVSTHWRKSKFGNIYAKLITKNAYFEAKNNEEILKIDSGICKTIRRGSDGLGSNFKDLLGGICVGI